MRAPLIGAALLVLAWSGAHAAVDADSLSAQFAAANKAYDAGDYAGAIAGYSALTDDGVADADLYYNLGNAHFEAGDLGHAVLWYERARRLNPRDRDIADNLALTRSLLRDQQLLPKQSRLRRALLVWHRATTVEESVVVATALYLLLCVLAVCFVFRREPAVSRMLARASMFSPGRLFGLTPAQDTVLAMAVVFIAGGLFAASAFIKIRDEHQRTRGVVVAEEVSVFSGPSRDSTVQFKVHEGTTVAVHDARDGWIRVDLPGDLSGWVDAGTLERI